MMQIIPFRNACLIIALLLTGFHLRGQQSLLLEYTPAGSSNSSYIFGILDNEGSPDVPVSTALNAAMKEVNTVAFEWLPERYELEQEADLLQINSTENNLKRYLKRDDNIRYELFILDKLQEEVADYANFTPLYTMQLFRNAFLAGSRDFHRDEVFDSARKNIKPVLSMLNIRQLTSLMMAVPFETQADILSNYVNNFSAYQQYEKVKLQLYLAQDLNGIARAVEQAEHPEYILLQRQINELLASKMEQLAAGQSVLFVVNVERLGGESGLLAMLRQRNAAIADASLVIQITEDQEQDVAGTTTEVGIVEEQPEADDFPGDLLFTNAVTPATDENRWIKVGEQQVSNPVFKAYTDPFGDRYDYLAADTAFLNEWYDLRSNDAFFNIKFPENVSWEESTTNSINGPIKTNTASTNHARSDLFYSVGYTIYPPNFNPEQKAPFFDDFVYRSVRKWKGDLLEQRILSDQEYTGRAFLVAVNDSFFVRSVLILKGNVLYQLLCGGPGDKPYDTYVEEFLRSFRLDRGKSGNWFLHADAGYSCYFPRQPLIDNQTINTQYGPLRITTLNAAEFDSQLSYFLSVNVYPSGYKLKGDKAFYKDLIADAERQYFGRALSVDKIKKGKHAGREVLLQLNSGEVYKMHFFIDNNAVYQYLVGGSASSVESANASYFLEQFQFTD